jgi:hypothetical protein
LKDKRTDNSFYFQKITLREEVIKKLVNEINILDCYAGKGKIWSGLIERNRNVKINYLGIEKEKKKNKNISVLEGDNLKYLKALDLSKFNLIDLDAYGIPYDQINVVMSSNFRGYVIVTFIHTGMGRLPDNMLLSLGYTKEMINKCPTLFSRNHNQKLFRSLYSYGVKSINFIEKNEKLYFYFKKD